MSSQGRYSSSGPRPIPSSSPSGDGRDSRSRTTSTARLASPVPSSMTGQIPQIPTPPPEFQSGTLSPLAGAAPSSPSRGAGRSSLAAALEGNYGRSPTRQGTPHLRQSSPGLTPRASVSNLGRHASDATSQRRESNVGVDGQEDAEVVSRHLVQQSRDVSRAGGRSVSRGRKPSADHGPDLNEFSSLQLQGGDTTREIYRWAEQAQNEATFQRSKSFSISRAAPEAASLRLPGAMRREYLQRGQSPAMSATESAMGGEPGGPYPRTGNFLQFLTLYGHFAGEELEDIDEEAIEDDDEDAVQDERTPLVSRPSMRRRGTSKRIRTQDKGSTLNAFMILMKSFVGTGILFLPRAFANGGMLFSILVLVGIAGLSYYCFLLLISTRSSIEASFGDLGGILYGNWLRRLILGSLVLSQLGFVSAYIVFTAENLRAFAFAVSNCIADVELKYLILAQLLFFLPMALFRDINKLSSTALIADAFIILGILYLGGFDVSVIAQRGGIAPSVTLFNPQTWSLFIGTAVFTFEGIALIVPIQEAMKKPEDFPKILFLTMVITTILFTGMGALSYATFGSDTKTVVLLNLPQDNKFVNAVQFLYSIAILLSTPLQLFPAIRILEQAFFSRSGKRNTRVKWYKNFFRFFLVILCALIAWGGAGDLDKFVSLVGSFACVPLVYIYPPLLHYKAVAGSRFRRISDLLLAAFGVGAMAYTSALTISSWAGSGGGSIGGPPDFCKT